MLTHLNKAKIARLVNAAAVYAMYDTSTTPKWYGDLAHIEFIDKDNRSVGHITQMSEEPTTHEARPYNPEFILKLRLSNLFTVMAHQLDSLDDTSTYRIV